MNRDGPKVDPAPEPPTKEQRDAAFQKATARFARVWECSTCRCEVPKDEACSRCGRTLLLG